MKKLIAIFILTNLIACNLPEHYYNDPITCDSADTNIVYKNNKYLKDEVHTTLKNSRPNQYRYFFKSFIEEDGIDKVVVSFRNKNICMDVLVWIDDLGKLTGMKRTKGRSYPKELYDLEWKLEKRNDKLEVVYLNMHDIID